MKVLGRIVGILAGILIEHLQNARPDRYRCSNMHADCRVTSPSAVRTICMQIHAWIVGARQWFSGAYRLTDRQICRSGNLLKVGSLSDIVHYK
jgi:hypothetical protein